MDLNCTTGEKQMDNIKNNQQRPKLTFFVFALCWMTATQLLAKFKIAVPGKTTARSTLAHKKSKLTSKPASKKKDVAVRKNALPIGLALGLLGIIAWPTPNLSATEPCETPHNNLLAEAWTSGFTNLPANDSILKVTEFASIELLYPPCLRQSQARCGVHALYALQCLLHKQHPTLAGLQQMDLLIYDARNYVIDQTLDTPVPEEIDLDTHAEIQGIAVEEELTPANNWLTPNAMKTSLSTILNAQPIPLGSNEGNVWFNHNAKQPVILIGNITEFIRPENNFNIASDTVYTVVRINCIGKSPAGEWLYGREGHWITAQITKTARQQLSVVVFDSLYGKNPASNKYGNGEYQAWMFKQFANKFWPQHCKF